MKRVRRTADIVFLKTLSKIVRLLPEIVRKVRKTGFGSSGYWRGGEAGERLGLWSLGLGPITS